MTRSAWLHSLKVGDTVAVYCGSEHINVETVTSASRTLVTTGKHARKASFRRKNGKLAGRRPLGHLFHIEPPT